MVHCLAGCIVSLCPVEACGPPAAQKFIFHLLFGEVWWFHPDGQLNTTLLSRSLFLSVVLSPSCCCTAVFSLSPMWSPRGTTNVAHQVGFGQWQVPFGAVWNWPL